MDTPDAERSREGGHERRGSQRCAPDAFARAGMWEMPRVALGTEVAALLGARRQQPDALEYSLIVLEGKVRPLSIGSRISLEATHINRTWGGRTKDGFSNNCR